MESNDSLLDSSEATKNGSPESPKSTTTDTEEKPTYIRFLVSNAGAGSVIGKGGSSIGDLQSKSGARIQLSRNHEFFPGTTERIIWISGSIDNIITAVDLVLVKLENELNAEDGNDVESRTKVRIIVPNSCCGCIIGKGGSTVKSFMEDSQAGIRISRPDTSYFGMSDRLVTVTGSLDEQMRAIDLILTKLTYESHYAESFVAPYSYQGVFFSDFPGVPYGYVLPNVATLGYSTINYGPNGGRGKFQNQKEDRVDSVTLGVSDEHIGLVVGRGGRNIMELNQFTGARVKISDRGDFMPGTTDRKVTITGTQRAIREAESMILKKVEYASERATIA